MKISNQIQPRLRGSDLRVAHIRCSNDNKDLTIQINMEFWDIYAKLYFLFPYCSVTDDAIFLHSLLFPLKQVFCS